jgi:S1-C subfamily serine protease
MRIRWFVAVGAVAFLPLVGQAQDVRRRVRVEVPPEAMAGDPITDLLIHRRARLGVKVSLQAQDTDSIGAYVDAVTPGGPAAKAGLRSGDIITKLDGKSLLESPKGPSERGQSLPGLKLIEVAARLEPDDTTEVEFRRGAERKTTKLVTNGDDAGMWAHAFGGPRNFALHMGPDGEMEGPVGPGMFKAPGFEMFLSGELADLELAPINPDLGQYFGTSEGILVVSVRKSSPLGLKAGDVVFAVDGRKPSGPAHLLRILRSYDRGESFKLDIMRNKKRDTVTGRLADSKERSGDHS